MLEKSKHLEKNGLEVLDSAKSRRTKNMLLKTNYMDVEDWSTHDEVIAAFSHESHYKKDEKSSFKANNGKGLQSLIKAWFLAQVGAISSSTGVEVNSLCLGSEMLIDFEVKGHSFGSQEDAHASSDGFLENIKKTSKPVAEILYVLTIPVESHSGGNVYELVFDELSNGHSTSEGAFFEKLEMGDPVSFACARERVFDDDTTTDVSSLSWMGTTVSDVINSKLSIFIASSFCFFCFFSLFCFCSFFDLSAYGETPTLTTRTLSGIILKLHNFILAQLFCFRIP